MVKNICQRNKFGYCKFGGKCHFRHEDEICVKNNCDILQCELRHPKKCTYFNDFGVCKFLEYCRYKHDKTCMEDEKVAELEKRIKDLENKFNTVNNKKPNNNSNQVEKLENQIKKLQEAIAEKENKLDELKEKLESIENACAEEKEGNKNMKKEFEEIKLVLPKVAKCDNCDFVSKSESAIRAHCYIKHPKKSKQKFPMDCNMCTEKNLKKSEVNMHMYSHFYRNSTYIYL